MNTFSKFCTAGSIVLLALAAEGFLGGCRSSSGRAPPSAREECQRVLDLAEKQRQKMPTIEQLAGPRLQTNAAVALREYAAQLDKIPLNNKLADYGDVLRKLAKSLDDLWTARESDKKSAVDATTNLMSQEGTMVSDINTYCQAAM
jgi:hypothetical protein